VSELVNPNLRAALLAEGEELFKKRAQLEDRLAALENLHNRLIDAAALHEINQQRARDLARADTPAAPVILPTSDDKSYNRLLRGIFIFSHCLWVSLASRKFNETENLPR
jgi:hypothetical protein